MWYLMNPRTSRDRVIVLAFQSFWILYAQTFSGPRTPLRDARDLVGPSRLALECCNGLHLDCILIDTKIVSEAV